ncbi:prephenate dehydrogenase [Anaeromyxobacter paludicola]|uniref:Prephenate/arogenate dehydrogenase domain-containing protein n=1 Tax=Anaeromyxobacter paludicola TaxID=2918171 RepID=A0ABM7XCG2_9BACT|nr:prephenate dehydrogenase [Anaeromyxobacter paludicola]BDG09555.1 hypothetical protein AMPC_26680 [Anaeromyxobacter paludicola]
MTGPFPRSLGVVGLGLMGGCLARGLKAAAPGARVVAVEPDGSVRARALAEGVADLALAEAGPALAECDLVALCTPIAAIEGLLGPVSRLLPDGAVLTDVGGAKERVLAAARREVRPGVEFVGGHPMFGGRGGFDSSRADRWQGGTVALCTDDASPEALGRVEALHRGLGAEVLRCTATEHDAAVAMVSHLPYLVACALTLAVKEAGPLAAALAGPGLDGMTRLAGFAFDIQGEVARRNAHLPETARRLQERLARILADIATSPDGARAALEEARAFREELF